MSVALAWVLASVAGAGAPDAGTAEPPFTLSPSKGAEHPSTIESFSSSEEPSSPIASFTEPAAGPNARLYGHLRAQGGVDTRFDSIKGAAGAEDVVDGWLRGTLGVDVKVSDWVRAVVEGRFQVRGAAQRDLDRARGFFEPMLGEAFVDLYTKKVDVRIGNQRLALGANAALAGADALNPRDLREDFLLADPEDAVLPVFAVRGAGEIGTLDWLLAYAPFFTPNRFMVFGSDQALLQPGLALGFDDRRVDPSVVPYGQERLLETQRPPPFAGDLALRLRSRGKVRIGASWVWMNEKMPRVVVDKELQAFLSAQSAGKPVDPATAASLSNRFQANETLFTGTYRRAHLLSLEASMLVGPGQLDLDVTYSPRQTFFDADLAPIDKPALTLVVGYSSAEQSDWVWAVQYLGLVIPDITAKEQVILIEPATAVGGARTAFLHLFVGQVGVVKLDDRLEVTVRGAFEPIQRSFAIGPKVIWRGFDRWDLWLAAEFYEGSPWSPLGYFGRNDQILAGARYELF